MRLNVVVMTVGTMLLVNTELMLANDTYYSKLTAPLNSAIALINGGFSSEARAAIKEYLTYRATAQRSKWLMRILKENKQSAFEMALITNAVESFNARTNV